MRGFPNRRQPRTIKQHGIRQTPKQAFDMANKQVIFADRMVGISLQNGLVRVDLASIAGPAKTKEGKDGVRMEITHQLVIPLEGFVEGLKMQQAVTQRLAARGKKKADAQVSTPATETPAAGD